MYASASAFVGRSAELGALNALWGSSTVWVWGPPGVGKSRLAHEWLSSTAESVVALDLSTTSTDDEFFAQLAQALGVVETGNDANRIETLRATARDDGRALLLDNIDPIRAVVESFLDGAFPRVIVTCRAAPSSDAPVSLRLAPLSEDEAAELFTTTARRANPAGTWDPTVLSRLLKRLDGLPLAIGFSASRTRVLTIEEQLSRLAAGSGSPIDGMVDWMWRELPADRRTLIIQCAAFTSGFTASAIEATADAPVGVDVLDGLDELVSASWLQRSQTSAGGYRFRLLNTLRDFALSAATAAELSAARERALTYWTERAPNMRASVEGRSGRDALDSLQVERENLLTAVDTGFARRDPRALVVLEALRWNACLIGPTTRYAELVEHGRVLARDCGGPTAARFLDFAAEFGRVNGYLSEAERDARAAVGLADSSGDEELIARTRTTFGGVDSGRVTDALTSLRDALARAETLGAHITRAAALERIGRCHLRDGDIAAAEECFRDALDTYRAYASDLVAGECHNGLGRALVLAGRPQDATARLSEALEEATRGGLRMQVPQNHYDIALAAQACGDADDAATHVARALSIWNELGAHGKLPAAWIASARISWEMDQPALAVGAARTAQRLAPAVGDTYNTAIAAGLTAMFLWADGRVAMDDDLLAGVPSLRANDPVAAVAHLAAFIGVRAGRGSSAQRELANATAIVAELGAAVTPANDLLAIARAFAHLCDANRGAAQHRAAPRALAAGELDALGTPTEFYARLLIGQARALLERLDAALVELPPGFRHDVEFHANCHWVIIDGAEPIDLSSRKQLRVIVKALARQHFIDAAVLLSVEELLEVGWPGETMTTTSGRSRIYTAIRDLRKMGLDALIVTDDGGYRLASDVRFRVAASTGILAH